MIMLQEATQLERMKISSTEPKWRKRLCAIRQRPSIKCKVLCAAFCAIKILDDMKQNENRHDIVYRCQNLHAKLIMLIEYLENC